MTRISCPTDGSACCVATCLEKHYAQECINLGKSHTRDCECQLYIQRCMLASQPAVLVIELERFAGSTGKKPMKNACKVSVLACLLAT